MELEQDSSDVAIVDGGSSGMLMALELSLQGLEILLFEPRPSADRRPRVDMTHVRSLSHLVRRGYIPLTDPHLLGKRSELKNVAGLQPPCRCPAEATPVATRQIRSLYRSLRNNRPRVPLRRRGRRR